ncbi:MAG: 23S rRNA (pseudouridine(1915)-N(3))-methyltransferase RlmH [Acutalibacteraceae bacterium]|nr:23S rRNA (pseudouridine(1915)-N(3))-methyltransferase RlmH [Acutalibacteraceae bacterium]
MLNINIICVGKLKEKYWTQAVAEYEKRLRTFCKFKITEVDEEKISDNPNSSQIETTLEKEGKRILKAVGKGAEIIALCIEGKSVSSPQLAQIFNSIAVKGKSEIDFIIGGSWGLSDEVKKIADIKLSMSEMTFPHQLARVMLCEQIYRGFQISSGGKYHK